MIKIKKYDHVGIRIKDKDRSRKFYELLGFEFQGDAGFTEGHPIIMKHPSGVVINLLGPTSIAKDENILMDISDKYSGYTHIALTVESRSETEKFLRGNKIEITGRFSFKNMHACFIRDPDRNVIELDEHYDTSNCEPLMQNEDCSPYDKHV